jgi:hypothetical protein
MTPGIERGSRSDLSRAEIQWTKWFLARLKSDLPPRASAVQFGNPHPSDLLP